jgi:hypothetical protein
VLFDGITALDEDGSFSRSDPESIKLATNPFHSTVIAKHFTGLVISAAQAADLSGIPPPHFAGKYGAVKIRVLFPRQAYGASEPLVVTGVTGAGDMLYVTYLDATHVSFGFDHWGFGVVGSPVKIDYEHPHVLEITTGALYPPGRAGPWEKRVRINLDGGTVLDQASACYPSRPEEIQIGKNPVGGSTCGPTFTGRILEVTRTAPPAD